MSDISEKHKIIMIFLQVHCNKNYFTFNLGIIYATAPRTEQPAKIYILYNYDNHRITTDVVTVVFPHEIKVF